MGIDGGWRIVNARKYREMQTNGQRLASERSKRYRQKAARSVTCRDHRDASRSSRPEGEGEGEAKTEREEQVRTTNCASPSARAHFDGPPSISPKRKSTNGGRNADAKRPPAPSWSQEASALWVERFEGTPPRARINVALSPLVRQHSWPSVREAWRSYLWQTEAEYASPQRFAATYGRWSGSAPPPVPGKSSGVKTTVGDGNMAVAARFIARGGGE